MNREAWLNELAEGLRPLFLAAGIPLKEKFHVSVGFPSTRATSTKKRRIGECWSHEASTDGHGQIFISPLLDTGMEAAAVLVHELVHDAIGCEKKHGPTFKRAMLGIGLTGKPTATHAGEALTLQLQELLSKLPAYPHAGITLKALNAKKQTTRGRKAVCPVCGYTVRVTRKWIDAGLPYCGVLTCDKAQFEEVLEEPKEEE